MKIREPVCCHVALGLGALEGATGRYTKALADLAGLYEEEESYAEMLAAMGSDIVYEVTEFRPSEAAGDMIFGVTRMVPGRVGNEYFMTRGHIHQQVDRPEMYYVQKGQGVMLMESPYGDIRTMAMGPQSICYVPPCWIHRSVNVGAEELVMVFAYPADSGQDYETIERAGGMRMRVIDDGAGGWKLAENARYRGRSVAEAAGITANRRGMGSGEESAA